MAERSDQARQLAAVDTKTSSDWVTSADAARAYAFSGDIHQSLAILDRLVKSYPENIHLQKIYRPELEALEAIERHDGRGAVAALENSRSHDFALDFTVPYVRGLTLLAAGQEPQAAAEFQKIVDHRGVWPLSPVHSLAHLGVARAYSLAGEKSKARLAYQDFLALWKDADPDTPILKQAKAGFESSQRTSSPHRYSLSQFPVSPSFACKPEPRLPRSRLMDSEYFPACPSTDRDIGSIDGSSSVASPFGSRSQPGKARPAIQQ